MTIEEAIDRVLNHANLPGPHTAKLSEDQSLSRRLRTPGTLNLDELTADLLEALCVIGRELAGQQSEAAQRLRLRIAYAASCTLCEGLRFGIATSWTAANLDRGLAKLAFALEQLLAGDIEDLLEGAGGL